MPAVATISFDFHVRPPFSLVSMHEILCHVVLLVVSSMFIPCMIYSYALLKSFFKPNLAMHGVVSWLSTLLITELSEQILLKLDHFLCELLISVILDDSIIEFTSSTKNFHKILLWLLSAFTHD